MKFTQIENDPNPRLERASDEECLATWWHQATPGTTYWRCLVPARHLPGQTLPLSHDDLVEDEEGQPFLHRQKGDTAIWQFLGDPYRSRVALGMKELYGVRTLMELDDNYLRAAPYAKGRTRSPWKETVQEAHSSGTNYSHEMHRAVVPLVDGLICSTQYLAEIYSEHHDNICVCPNSIDPGDWQYERKEPDDIFRIVYYGSPSHLQDTPIITKALKWASRQPRVEVWTAGFNNPSWSFPHNTISWNPELDKARANLFKFDLGLAPLRGNPWSRGKSDIKALEYAAAGVLPLMSREEPFKPWFDLWPEFTLEDGEWLDKIKYWVSEGKESVNEVAGWVKEWVFDTRSIDQTIDLWRQAINA